MNKKVDKIRELVKGKYKEDIWRYHILPVVKYSLQLADIYKADKEITELGALLHDVGRTGLEDKEGHHILGVPIAEKILQEHNFPKETIKEVKHCIEAHRTGKGPSPKTMPAKIIANADAMAHFDVFPMFFYWEGIENEKFDKAMDWAENKLNKDWDEKLTLPKAKKIVEKNRQAINILLEALKQYRK